MSLQSQLQAAVAAATPSVDYPFAKTTDPTRGTTARAQELITKKVVSLDSSNNLSVRADSVGQAPELALETTLSSAAVATLATLKELVAAGVLGGVLLHDGDAGVVLRTVG